MVENHTADGWVSGEISGERLLNLYANDSSRFTVAKELGENEEYIAFNLNSSTGFVNSFNDTLNKLKENQTDTNGSVFSRIVARYLPTD
jgi:hypothetical protein